LEAVTGRKVFYFGEYVRLIAADNIVNVYRNSRAAKDWATWAEENPRQAEILVEAMRIYDNS